jgi:hypothetical protein
MDLIPGKNIGIVAAQSITSSLTQTVLNAFHACGANDSVMTRGLPRLLDLLSLGQKTSPATYTFVPKEGVSLSPGIPGSRLIVRVDVGPPPKWARGVSPDTIGIIIGCSWQLAAKWRIPLSIFDFFLSSGCMHLTTPMYDVYVWGRDCAVIEFEILPLFASLQFGGIEGITSVEGGLAYAPAATRLLFCEFLRHDAIDPLTATSSSIWDIFEMFGVEAARVYLFEEITRILDSCIFPVHKQLLVNHMTWPGQLQSISRYSIREDLSAVITKVSFEESMLNFLNAMFRGDVDSLAEVSPCVLVGNRCRLGTGFFDLLSSY